MVIASKGAAGVTGAGLATLAGGLSSHRPELLDGVGLIVGIDRFMSEARALTNFAGNAVATVLIGTWTDGIDREQLDARARRGAALRRDHDARRRSVATEVGVPGPVGRGAREEIGLLRPIGEIEIRNVAVGNAGRRILFLRNRRCAGRPETEADGEERRSPG